MAAPLYDALAGFLQENPARFCMPGHKGRAVTPALSAGIGLDLTELPPTGNLYAGGDVIAQAEALWAEAWGYPHAQFLTGGATQGLHAALLLAAQEGDAILADRRAHRAIHHGMALWNLRPVWLPCGQDTPLSPDAVAAALETHRDIKTVCITSPTYYGVLSDVAAIGAVCHRFGARLVVDAAHGAHLPFLGQNPFLGADLVVTSPHKTLPVYGQGAVLLGNGDFPNRRLRWAAAVTGTSSPSYPVMASLDWAREWATGAGQEEIQAGAAFVARCRAEFFALTGDNLDSNRLTLCTARPGEGFLAQEELEKAGVWPEMADCDHVVCIVSGCETAEDRERLFAAAKGCGRFTRGESAWRRTFPQPPAAEQVLGPREALFARRERMPLRAAVGRVAAESVAPYPPGIPVIAPGERVTKKSLAYLEQIGYNVDIPVEICQTFDP